MSNPFTDNEQSQIRLEHLAKLRELTGNVYPNKFERSNVLQSAYGADTVSALLEKYGPLAPHAPEGQRPAPEDLERVNAQLNPITVRIAGRLATPPRVMGKVAFVHLSDGKTRLQIYVRRDDVVGVRNDGETPGHSDAENAAASDTQHSALSTQHSVNGWELFGLCDHGDFIGVEGYLFVTKMGELSVHVKQLQFLAKALLPMPDKIHGINDPEIRQRQRYADLIAGSLKIEHEEGELSPRQVFERRAKVITTMRRFLDEHGYIEVETPMLAPLATGAAARPFVTHHNALDIPLYARIAPELYLKRLTVGGFERVYELNRNFRNEGVSHKHNPEFTMLEFYCAYMNVNGMMDFCEELLKESVKAATGGLQVTFEGQEIDFSKFERRSMKEAISDVWLEHYKDIVNEDITLDRLNDARTVLRLASTLPKIWPLLMMTLDEDTFIGHAITIPIQELFDNPARHLNDAQEKLRTRWSELWSMSASDFPRDSVHFAEHHNELVAKAVVQLFELVAEPKLIQPTFITDHPKAISPLSKASPENPAVAERFELFIAGMECANGFSELNDPSEQRERFLEQMAQRDKGDDEAMVLDDDYIRALSYGMPPAAGIGIGIDRLVMLLTNRRSIRDVILFPHLRPERQAGET